MKNALLTLAVLIASLFGNPDTLAADWAQLGRYAAANDSLKSLPHDDNRIVFIGNSITDFWPGKTSFFADNGIVGRGIAGQTSYQFLVRMRPDVIDLHPLAVVINVGTNDVAENAYPFDLNATMANIKCLVAMARDAGIKVILSSVLPASSFSWRPAVKDAPAKIAALNAEIKSYAESQGLPYVDYFTALVDTDGASLPQAYGNDGVHPNEAGYAVMEATVLPFINAARAQK